jgi:hypothetical protein
VDLWTSLLYGGRSSSGGAASRSGSCHSASYCGARHSVHGLRLVHRKRHEKGRAEDAVPGVGQLAGNTAAQGARGGWPAPVASAARNARRCGSSMSYGAAVQQHAADDGTWATAEELPFEKHPDDVGWLPGPVGGDSGRPLPVFKGRRPGPTDASLNARSSSRSIIQSIHATKEYCTKVVEWATLHAREWQPRLCRRALLPPSRRAQLVSAVAPRRRALPARATAAALRAIASR